MRPPRFVKTAGKRALLAASKAGARVGLFVLPKHYYVPIADPAELRRTKAQWAHRSALTGIDADVDDQAARMRAICAPFAAEYAGNRVYLAGIEAGAGPGFGYIEAQALHGVVRTFRPKRIIEVGSGVSTYCMIEAARLNGGPGAITCVEPYPSAWLRGAPVQLVAEKAEAVAPALFDALGEGDLLFIDSSHTVKIGGDVTHLVLEVLPRLKPGVVIHFHDIYLPYDYQRDADNTVFQWMETALLHAFLAFNRRFRILFCLSHLHYDRPEALKAVFPEYAPQASFDGLQDPAIPAFAPVPGHFPASIFLQVAAE